MTTVNFMDRHAEFVGKQIDQAVKGTGIHELYKRLARLHVTREIFVYVYQGLVNTKQIEAIEKIEQEKKDEIWNEVLNATRDMADEYKGAIARTNLAKCIYLIKIAIEP